MDKKELEQMLDKIKSDANLSLEQKEKAIKEANEAFTKEAVKNLATADEVKAIKDEAAADKVILKAQGEEIAALKLKLDQNKKAEVKSVYEMIEEKHAEIIAGRKKQNGEPIEFRIKSVTSVSASTSTSSAPANPWFPLPTDTGKFVDIRKPHLFILNYIDLGATTSPNLIWTEETSFVLGAAIVTEGNLKPQVTQSAVRRMSAYKKIAAYITITEELEKDLPRLTTQFMRLFNDKVDRKYNYQVLADIIAIAPGYVSTTLNGTIQTPNEFDAIAAGIAQCQSSEFMPDSLFMNPNDLWRIGLTKDANGRYNMPAFVTITAGGMQYGNLKLEVSNQITAGNFLLGEAKTYKVDVYEDYSLRIGYVNDDMIRNQYSAVGEIKFHSYIATNEISGWVYANFQTVKGVIAKP